MTDPIGETAWPESRLDRIGRLRALAAGLPGAWVEERTIRAPFDTTWGFLRDLERSVPEFESDVSRLRVLRRQGSRLRIRATVPWTMLRLPAWFDVDLEDGWCLMVSRPHAYVIVMAAEPAGDATRFAHLEGLAPVLPRAVRPLGRLVAAVSRWRHRRHVPRDVDGIERAIARRT